MFWHSYAFIFTLTQPTVSSFDVHKYAYVQFVICVCSYSCMSTFRATMRECTSQACVHAQRHQNCSNTGSSTNSSTHLYLRAARRICRCVLPYASSTTPSSSSSSSRTVRTTIETFTRTHTHTMSFVDVCTSVSCLCINVFCVQTPLHHRFVLFASEIVSYVAARRRWRRKYGVDHANAYHMVDQRAATECRMRRWALRRCLHSQPASTSRKPSATRIRVLHHPRERYETVTSCCRSLFPSVVWPHLDTAFGHRSSDHFALTQSTRSGSS